MSGRARVDGVLVLTALYALATANVLTFAQEPATCPDSSGLFAAYDIVSVKPVNPNMSANTAVFHHPDGIDGSNVTVDMIVRSSYSYTFNAGNFSFANADVIAGLPDWAKNDRFALQAKMSPEQLAVFAKLEAGQQRACQDQMERAMLADRFKFRMHRQPRQVPAYDLVVAKGGPKFKESGTEPDAPVGPDGNPQTMSLSMRGSKRSVEVVMSAHFMSMEDLANFLGFASVVGLNHTVFDKTGLTGHYRFIFAFPPAQGMRPAGGQTEAAAADPESSISTELEDRLGLSLKRTTVTYDAVVVDHVERPAAN
jgi:uncharacterized protein (TIGR03435 family)